MMGGSSYTINEKSAAERQPETSEQAFVAFLFQSKDGVGRANHHEAIERALAPSPGDPKTSAELYWR
jgi:hypothetical protein